MDERLPKGSWARFHNRSGKLSLLVTERQDFIASFWATEATTCSHKAGSAMHLLEEPTLVMNCAIEEAHVCVRRLDALSNSKVAGAYQKRQLN